MYGLLLALAMADVEPGGEVPVERDLVRHLTDVRARLAPPSSPLTQMAVDAVESLAAHVDYDRTLLLLCRNRGIACGPEQFSRPDAERRRLEAALMAEGVALAGIGSRH